MHLYYKIPSKYLIDKLSDVWDGEVHVSMIEEGRHNEYIAEYLRTKFSKVHIVYVANKGNDIYGFFNCFRQYETDKKWILYLHDKHLSKLDWLDDITDPILCQENLKKVSNIINSEKTKCGIICSQKYKKKLDDEERLIEVDKHTEPQRKGEIVKARQTLLWLRELQYLLSAQFGYVKKDDLTFDFMAGTVFFIQSEVVKLAHRCVYKEYFIDAYKNDGEVQHAIERFYFYVNLCLNLTTLYLETNGEDE